MKAKFYTIGYAGRKIDGFIDELKARGIRWVIDSRSRANSMKKDFNKTRLEQLLLDAGIFYIHKPALGTNKTDRAKMDRPSLLAKYRELLSKPEDDNPTAKAYMEIIRLIDTRKEDMALMCVEREYGLCHLSVLADDLNEWCTYQAERID